MSNNNVIIIITQYACTNKNHKISFYEKVREIATNTNGIRVKMSFVAQRIDEQVAEVSHTHSNSYWILRE